MFAAALFPLILSTTSSSAMAEDCMELGWSGGSAGAEIRYVRAHLLKADPATGAVVMRYDHHNGQLFLTVTEEGWSSMAFRGTWTQDDNKSGDIYLRFSDELQKGVGYWTSAGQSQRYDLFLRECP